MKKILLSSVALLAIAFSSCDDNNKNDWPTDSVNIQTSSSAVLIPLSANDEPVFLTDYTLRYSQSMSDGKVSVRSMKAITLPDGTAFSFESPATGITGNQFTTIVEPMPFTDKDGLTLRMHARLTSQYYAYNKSTGKIDNINQVPISVMTLNIGSSYVLKTIQNEMAFSGKTTTLINGENPYSNAGIVYQLNLDIANGKASVTIYNAKFAEAAPNIRILRLRNLTLKADRSSGYTVTGTDIVPEVLEGSEWVPNQRFTFNEFRLVPTSDNLSIASINYCVAGVYTGTCVGTYIVQ